MTAIASPSNTIQTSGPARRGKQKIVVVLGMHRSGTSLLTNLLSVLGVDLGKDLLAGDSANELGYWENESIYRTQDALLNHIAQDWGELGAVYPFAIDWSRLPEFQSYKQELISIVRAEITRAEGIWGFKDPRTCRLLPLWKEIFAELDLDPLYVLALRDPVVVADSMQKRSALDPLHTELVWLLYTLDAIRDAGDKLRVVVDYDRWFTAPCEQAKAVADALELAWPANDKELVDQLTQTIRSDLRHSKSPRPCSLPFVAKIYEILKKTAVTGGTLDSIARAEFRIASDCLGAALELSAGAGKIALALGHAEVGAGNLEAAVEAYTRAVRLQPRLASAFSSRASVLQSLGRSAEAFESANQALSLDPNDVTALKIIAKNQLNNGQINAAENTCRLILRRNLDDAQALQMLKELSDHKQQRKQSADNLFAPGAARVAPPPIVPAPIRSRSATAPSPVALVPPVATRVSVETAASTNGHHKNGHSASSQAVIMKPAPEGGVCAEIGEGDVVFTGDRTHYFGVGESALHCIHSALGAAKKPAREIRRILDLPCGHGRVMRYLKAAFPQASLTACDLNRRAVDFCARTFAAEAVYSDTNLDRIAVPGKFDLIWCGSLLTHLRAEPCAAFVRWFCSRLNPGALLFFTTHGRWVERSLALGRYKYGLRDDQVAALLEEYYLTGFGYADYLGATGYGISVSSPAYVLGKLVCLPDFKLITLHEKGWDNHQDVICVQKTGPAELLG